MTKIGRPPVLRQTVSCETCGKKMERRVTDIARNTSGRFFCSLECQGRSGSKPRKGTYRPCQTCGKIMYVGPGAQERQKYCSRECHDKYQARNRVTCVCETCGKEYRVPQSRAGYRKVRFCSKRCEGDAHIKRPLERLHNGRVARLNKDGYVMIHEPTHPKAGNGGWVAEHRFVVEQVLGRYLESDEHVHHVNGVKDDNRIENLQVMDSLDHLILSGVEHRKEQQAMLAELAEYRKRFGPLNE